MSRLLALILLACVAFVATGAAAFVHERLAHADAGGTAGPDAGRDHGTGGDGNADHGRHRPADAGHDGHAACVVCHALHAPLAAADAPATILASNAVVGRVLDVQAQRRAAAAAARLGCRGPPVVRLV